MYEGSNGSLKRHPFEHKRASQIQRRSIQHKHNYLDLAHVVGHARHILPPLNPSQPAIADVKISCWGKEPYRSSLLSLLFVTFFFWFYPVFSFFRCFAFFQLRVPVRVLLVYVFGFLLSLIHI